MNALPKCCVCDLPGAVLRLQYGEVGPWWLHPACWIKVRSDFPVETPEPVDESKEELRKE